MEDRSTVNVGKNKLQTKFGKVKRLNVEHPTSTIERVLMTLRFNYFK